MNKRDELPAKLSAKELPKDLAEGSLKRINGSTTLKRPERDSDDSAVPSSHIFQDERRKSVENMQQQHRPASFAGTEEQEDEPACSSMTTPSLPVQASSGTQERPSFSLQGRALDQMMGYPSHDLQSSDGAEAESHIPPLPSLLLVDSFLAAIAGPFGDQSPKGSRTRVRTLLREADLSQPAEIVMCLIRAYLVARDTRAIRPEHCHLETGQVNRMPLFCAMVPRFVDVSRQGSWWDSDWQLIEEETSSDPCLAQWWREHAFQGSRAWPTATDLHEAQLEGTDAPYSAESDGMPTTPLARNASTRRVCLSQTDDAREERAASARTVLRHLRRMAVPIQDASVLWEHVTCGNPLYHRSKGREVCALCFPDPEWPEEAIALLHSIVEEKHEEGDERETTAWTASPLPEKAPSFGSEVAGWADRDEAYANAVRLLDALAGSGYAVEVFLELIGDGYLVVVRGGDGELICEHSEQVEDLIWHAQNGTL